MQPTRAIWRKGLDLLAADTTSLGASTACKVHLFNNAASIGLDMVLTDFTECTFTGSAALSVGTGTQPTSYDASDGVLTMDLLSPVGGFNWTCTATPSAPETVYGYYVTDSTNAILYAAGRLPNPLTINASGQSVLVGDITIKYKTDAMY